MPVIDALQLRQAAVEEVAAAGEHDDRQLLRPRPREHVGERHHVVLLAVDHDGVGGHGLDGEAAHGGADQHQALARSTCLRDARLHERAEREAGEHDRQRVPKRSARVREHAASASSVSPIAFVEASLRLSRRRGN